METVLKINKKNVTKFPERQHHVSDTCRPEYEHMKSLCTWSLPAIIKLVIELQVEERKKEYASSDRGCKLAGQIHFINKCHVYMWV